MPSISPLIVHLFDDPHGKRRARRERDVNRDRFASKERVPRRRSKEVD
jgi:hypothetical protein